MALPYALPTRGVSRLASACCIARSSALTTFPRLVTSSFFPPNFVAGVPSIQQHRSFQNAASARSRVPDFAFALDIDGVLLRSSTPIPGATQALSYLQAENIPFILLTNGGGKSEEERVADLQERLKVPLDTGMFVQSHTPFADLTHLHDKTVLVLGGEQDKCQLVAQKYGFRNVITPADIVVAHPDIWPFSNTFMDYYKRFAKPLPKPINASDPDSSLSIDAIFVYNDPRDWALDSTIILDLLLSRQGIFGTVSAKNGDASLPNNGYLQDSQPPLFYSNPDLWWAASYPQPRLGQGGFREALDGVWGKVTNGATLTKAVFGKPSQPMYEFAETRLRWHRKRLFGQIGLNDPLRRVYMVGDNPASDIAGANSYQSPHGSQWQGILVKTGVYQEGTTPAHQPKVIVQDVLEAVQWAVEDAKSST